MFYAYYPCHYSPSSFAFPLPPFRVYVIWEKGPVSFFITNSAKFQLLVYQYAQDIKYNAFSN